MRLNVVGVLVWVLGSSCLGSSMEMTRRVALSTLPSAPAAMSGGSGVRINAAMVAGALRPTGDGTSFPMFQPDLGVTLQLGSRSYFGGRISLAAAGLGATMPGGLPPPADAAGFDMVLGGGHDLPFTPNFGVSLSGELGFTVVSVSTESSYLETHPTFVPTGRLAVGLYGTPGPFRIYGGGSIGTTILNDATGTRTVDCDSMGNCNFSETGSVTVAGVGLLGGGVRWQANPVISVALEGWVPVAQPGTQIPFIASLSLRLGDFALLQPHKAEPVPTAPPPPPPAEVPEVEETPAQL